LWVGEEIGATRGVRAGDTGRSGCAGIKAGDGRKIAIERALLEGRCAMTTTSSAGTPLILVILPIVVSFLAFLGSIVAQMPVACDLEVARAALEWRRWVIEGA
jgi:hypothetical protein